MDMKTLRDKAREGMKGFCRVCPICDGKSCCGQMPGMGGIGTGSAFIANYAALRQTRVNMRVVHDATAPDTSLTLFGEKLNFPIMGAPMAACNINCGPYDDYAFEESLMFGAANAGTLGWIGDPSLPEAYENGMRAMQAVKKGVIIIKPHKNLDEIYKRFERAGRAGAVAFGVDLDGAGILLLKKLGYPMSPKTIAELSKLRAFAPDKPFIVKGVMTPDDALRCGDAGVSHIVVSNHGGRVLDHTPGVAEVLPGIRRAVGDTMHILADGAVRSGVDVLKYIALGAQAVLVGRPLCWGVYGGGGEGVRLVMEEYATQLTQAMVLTGCRDLSEIDSRVIYGM
ncbi:MAG: alpha-hydroxy-acid oxidizing protein [Clostridiales bacterium]|jgi:isopentenyl diphosphate isomerase/L-lactate dehydrogenase-like FMN-dependent dehydrogenase|nr:alpha-hydroxy-acid oxidizing protein [Clostridiales bacterium]